LSPYTTLFRSPEQPGHRGMPFNPLRWTTDESRAIESLAQSRNIDSVWLKEAAATKPAVLSKIKNATWVHFATHGFVPAEDDAAARNPLVESGLALSGANTRDPVTLQSAGILTAEEILDADMTHARLVVLSACRTALGIKA